MRDKENSEQQTNNDNGYNNFIFPTTEHSHEEILFGEWDVDIRLIVTTIAGSY